MGLDLTSSCSAVASCSALVVESGGGLVDKSSCSAVASCSTLVEDFGLVEVFGLAEVRQDLRLFEELEEREGLSSLLLSAKAVLVAKLGRLKVAGACGTA